jgi:pimeloyl-ACP methyl ester carboxylesterase
MKLIEFKNHKKEILRALIDSANSDRGVLFVHGFERTTIEYKFKNIVDQLTGKVNLFRFDFAGCGMSDGDFTNFTVAEKVLELEAAIVAFKKVCPKLKKVTLVGHSIAGPIIVSLLQEKHALIDKVIWLGPAFNHRALLRYYFVRAWLKGKKVIDYSNYEKYFSNLAYTIFLKKKIVERKAHYMSMKYYHENMDIDYSDYLGSMMIPLEKILIVHGLKDEKVPLESCVLPKVIQVIKVKGGDHELEEPTQVKQYLSKVIKFIQS